MTWVDIANLRGPQGDQGPVNVGLRQTDPITYAALGGFTFNLADGGQQTVNIPLATAQSAGLLAAQDKARFDAAGFDSGLRNVVSLLSTGWTTSNATVTVERRGNTVTFIARNVGYVGMSIGTVQMLTLPAGFRPSSHLFTRTFRNAASSLYSTGIVNSDNPTASVDYFYFTYLTRDAVPSVLPGVAA